MTVAAPLNLSPSAALALHCPACSEPLAGSPGSYHCVACTVSYPPLGDVSCLLPGPEIYLANWRARIHREQQDLLFQADRARDSLRADGLSAATQHRLTTLAQGAEQQLQCLETLLEPLLANQGGSDRATYSALGVNGLDDDTTLFSYAANLFRDWQWGAEENAQALAMVTQAHQQASDRIGPGRTLVLGAGGGRLAWDLAGLEGAEVWAVDINPFTSLAAAALCAGGSVRLWEFPLAPITTQDVALERELIAPPVDSQRAVHWLLADARALPFAPNSFDTVVTPWFTDVVQSTPENTAQLVNQLLCEGGCWVNFGSVAFANASPGTNLVIEELCELVGNQGFATPYVLEQTGPYLRSPHSRFARLELLHALAACNNAPADGGRGVGRRTLKAAMVEQSVIGCAAFARVSGAGYGHPDSCLSVVAGRWHSQCGRHGRHT